MNSTTQTAPAQPRCYFCGTQTTNKRARIFIPATDDYVRAPVCDDERCTSRLASRQAQQVDA